MYTFVRVRTDSGLATYPDVAAICGPSIRHAEDNDAITNPELIVEVLRPGTEETSTVVRDGEVAELAIGARLDVRELYDAAEEPKA